jgi:hypothetical protein
MSFSPLLSLQASPRRRTDHVGGAPGEPVGHAPEPSTLSPRQPDAGGHWRLPRSPCLWPVCLPPGVAAPTVSAGLVLWAAVATVALAAVALAAAGVEAAEVAEVAAERRKR